MVQSSTVPSGGRWRCGDQVMVPLPAAVPGLHKTCDRMQVQGWRWWGAAGEIQNKHTLGSGHIMVLYDEKSLDDVWSIVIPRAVGGWSGRWLVTQGCQGLTHPGLVLYGVFSDAAALQTIHRLSLHSIHRLTPKKYGLDSMECNNKKCQAKLSKHGNWSFAATNAHGQAHLSTGLRTTEQGLGFCSVVIMLHNLCH